ncbi:response regulator transcription factor [Shewanella amazonensis]|uniref:Response regulator receiver protein n=1 Tax=Shewanella amazonensis (strain ATCC BAA-1098 / SB2B) TaxID=326297 RepID=A1S410_SHEAM|nr:response regulator [Shewanella amazonensis]ABL99116.1 response regulator receiver protein [Shewanella amazonensis SB2B]
MEQLKVWIVDDDNDYCHLMREVLQEDYDVRLFLDADSYSKAMVAAKPDIILMDINLPDVSGIELCKSLQTHGIDSAVIFVSGMNTLEERLKAYEAGGVDFIAKPFELKELMAKTNAVANYQHKKRALAEAESFSRNMAFQSMNESSQYGAVLQFFRQCFLCQDYQALADAFFALMMQLDLKTCLEIRVDETLYFVPEHMAISPIEANIFELLDHQGRLFDFGSRTICNDKHVSFLIKNMPLQDEVLYGRLRDVIAVVVEGLEARIIDIQRQQTLQRVVTDIRRLLAGLSDSIHESDEQFCHALSNITTEIRASFHVLDMTEEQESFFTGLVERNLREANSASNSFLRLQTSLKSVVAVLERNTA